MKLPKITFLLFFLIVILLIILVVKALFGNSSSTSDNLSSPVPVYTESSETPAPASSGNKVSDSFEGEADDYKQVEQIQDEKPWLKNLSIVEPTYYIRYEYSDRSIEIVVYTRGDGSKHSDSELANIKSEVEKKLTDLGADLSKERIKFREENINE